MDIPEFLSHAREVKIPKGTQVFKPGDICSQFVYLKSGTIRVDLISTNGKPVTLYRFGAGQTCVLTTSCILGNEPMCGEAITESDVEAYVISIEEFQKNLNTSAEFRNLVFSSFSHRLSSIITKIDELTSEPVEKRLAASLVKRINEQNKLFITHEELATDIGTAREVISRKLREWHNLGIIKQSRGTIEILDLRKLKTIL